MLISLSSLMYLISWISGFNRQSVTSKFPSLFSFNSMNLSGFNVCGFLKRVRNFLPFSKISVILLTIPSSSVWNIVYWSLILLSNMIMFVLYVLSSFNSKDIFEIIVPSALSISFSNFSIRFCFSDSNFLYLYKILNFSIIWLSWALRKSRSASRQPARSNLISCVSLWTEN